MITIKPTLNRDLNSHEWDRPHVQAQANCYCAAMNAFDLAAVKPGSLQHNDDNPVDNAKLCSQDGLAELMNRDGWVRHDDKHIDPSSHHCVAIFGYRKLGMEFNECHFFGVIQGGYLIEKRGIGNPMSLSVHAGERVKADDILSYFTKDRATAVMPPIWGGWWRMPDDGLKAHPRHLSQGPRR